MIEVEVTAIHGEAEGIRAFRLASLDGTQLPLFTAGAHIDVHLPGGLIRQYSLCGDPDAGGPYEIAVLREPASRGGSEAMHGLAEGARLRIGPPRNLFPLAEDAPTSLLLAGGIGITPMLAMAQRLHRLGGDFTLHYCARKATRAAFLARLREAPFAARVALHFDDGPAAQRLDAAALLATASGAHVYVCGPSGFMAHVLDTARALNWPEASLHREYFTAPPTARADAEAFELEIASTGEVLVVPAGETALRVLLAHGHDIPYSCEQGICGTCPVPLLAGEPDHRDSFMTEDEHARNNEFAPCCSRAKTARLVLNL